MESRRTCLARDLGEMLVETKMITEEKINRVRELQAKSGDNIERILLQERLITSQQLAFFTSLQLGVPFVNLKKEGVRASQPLCPFPYDVQPVVAGLGFFKVGKGEALPAENRLPE